jgi:DNA-binding transcriptional MerR regulator
MLRIGEFSRLSQVTVNTLRHYDDIGLLKPAQIDRFTSYRYYTLEQLSQIHRIMVLKELGLSLDQITQIMKSALTPDQLRGMLMLKEAELRQRVDEEVARLARVKFHLRQIEMEAVMNQLDVRIKKIEAVRALTYRRIVSDHGEIDRIGEALQKALREHNVKTAPPPFSIVYAEEYNQHDVDMEFVIPVDPSHQGDLPLETGGTMTLRDVPGVDEAASYIYSGDPDNINDHLVDIQRWAAEHGYKLVSTIRMVMLRGPFEHLPADEWMEEIQYPLEKA